MKFLFYFILFILLFSINLLIIDTQYYFITPIFLISPYIYKVSSILVLFLVCFTLIILYKKKSISIRFIFILFINFILYTLFNLFSFCIISTFFLFCTKLFQFIASLYLNEETFSQDKTSAKLLTPYVIWCFYLTLCSISIFFLNNC